MREALCYIAGLPVMNGQSPALMRSRRKSVRFETSRAALDRIYRILPMKADIHPQYHLIKVVMTDGTEFVTRSTYGSEGATLNLDIDPKTHPAWTGGSAQLLDRGGRLSRFNSRFAGLNFAKK
jgi:large subunit ribosomal protein L31